MFVDSRRQNNGKNITIETTTKIVISEIQIANSIENFSIFIIIKISLVGQVCAILKEKCLLLIQIVFY